eukprot:769574-Pyramimonas_sp.AAC.1
MGLSASPILQLRRQAASGPRQAMPHHRSCDLVRGQGSWYQSKDPAGPLLARPLGQAPLPPPSD